MYCTTYAHVWKCYLIGIRSVNKLIWEKCVEKGMRWMVEGDDEQFRPL